MLRNPVEIEKFRFASKGNGKALYLANINPRKRQAFWSKVFENKVIVDFVGPWIPEEEPNFHENAVCTYLGVWDKQTVYDHLTDYSCLVLLSRSEADALVVKEALAAGLSVVVNEACSANLTHEEFVTILPDDEVRPEVVNGAIQSAIDNNYRLRDSIRDYAQTRFSYEVVVPEYLEIIEEFLGRVE